MSYLMGIDLGSTSLKAAVYDLEGNLISFGSSPTVLSYLNPEHPKWSCWEPEKIWAGVCAATKKALSGIDDAGAVKAVAVTGFGYDGLPVDADGRWLYPFIAWHCHRTLPQSNSWVSVPGAEKVFSVSGRLIYPINTIFRMMWLQENHPDIMERAYKWLMIEDFINYMLCGVMATDHSMASCTSVFDLAARTWSDDLIRHSGIDKSILPDIKPSGTFLGEVTQHAGEMTGLSEGTAVVLGGHDYHCASIPAGGFNDGVLVNITGTWEMLLAAAKRPETRKQVLDAGITVEAHVARDHYSLMAAEVSGGIMEWFKDNYGYEEQMQARESGDDVWSHLMQKAAQAPCGSKGVFLLPYFSGRSCIVPDSKALGAFVGLSSSVDKGDMIRAVVEGLNYQFREMLMSIENAAGKKYDRIISVGGVTRNALLMQNKADVSGRILEAVDIEEATSLGAALLAGIGTGVYKDEQQAFERTFRSGRIYTPDRSLSETYNGYYQIYRQLYSALKDVNASISHTFKA